MLKGKFGEIFKKGFMIFGGLAFLWMSGSRVIDMIFNPPDRVQNEISTPAQSAEDSLKESAKGYEIVLEKEPNNRFALEELVKTYLQLNDLQSSLKPMEKLVEIEPGNQTYQATLEAIKKGLEEQKNSQSSPNSPPSSSSEN
jgi:hypothetical protein